MTYREYVPDPDEAGDSMSVVPEIVPVLTWDGTLWRDADSPNRHPFDCYKPGVGYVCGYNEAGDRVCELPNQHAGEHEWTGELPARAPLLQESLTLLCQRTLRGVIAEGFLRCLLPVGHDGAHETVMPTIVADGGKRHLFQNHGAKSG